MTDQAARPGCTDMAKLAYDTWLRALGVSGGHAWGALPVNARERWDVTARAIAAAERDRMTSPAAVTAGATALHRYSCRTCGLDGLCKGEATHFDVSAVRVVLQAVADLLGSDQP